MQSKVMASATEIEREEKALGNWPRRLLHVPTMTSYEWQPGNVYRTWASPTYNAITYTWGRWRLAPDESPQVQPIDICGVPWAVPRVKTECFTAGNLLDVLKRATRPVNILGSHLSGLPDVGFVWLDIACIDQRGDDPRSTAEVGRQFVIFKGARWVFAWLHTTSLENLNSSIDTMENLFRREVCEYARYAANSSDIYERFFSSATLARVRDSLSTVFGDPWFTSLWTLQEAFLRQDAVMVSREGIVATLPDAVLYTTVYDATLTSLVDNFSALVDVEMRREGLPEPYSQCMDLIENSGVAALSTLNPLAVYAATDRRTTIKDEDRIYGIQQIFQLRLGTSSGPAPGTHVSRKQLEIQLGEQLLRHYPILSQSHVFTAPAHIGRGWLVNTTSIVPSDLMGQTTNSMWTPGANNTWCELSVRRLGDDDAWGHFAGNVCLFSALHIACVEFERNRPPGIYGPDEENYLLVHLDATPELSGSPEFSAHGDYEEVPQGPRAKTARPLPVTNLCRHPIRAAAG